MTLHIIARCPLRHDHCVPMSDSFVSWLKDPTHKNVSSFHLSQCPWGVTLEPKFGDRCPNCGQPYDWRNRRYADFCCAYPLED